MDDGDVRARRSLAFTGMYMYVLCGYLYVHIICVREEPAESKMRIMRGVFYRVWVCVDVCVCVVEKRHYSFT